MQRVLITGADGVIGRVIRDRLPSHFDLRLLTHRPSARPSHVAPIEDIDAIQPAFREVDAVVHLAGESRVDAPWQSVLPANVIGTYNVLEAARRAGVDRVVFASTNHVIGMYEADGAPGIYAPDDGRTFGADVPVRPDSLYGASKVFGEAVGRLYADRYGIRVICLRIGAVTATDDPHDAQPGRPFGPLPELTLVEARQRLAAVWLSHRDCAELVRCALVADVRWAVVYGTSDNPRKLWDLEGARTALGYVPRDSSARS
jgi:NAD+ dependent glucose-6-phosphate dehydrogenase